MVCLWHSCRRTFLLPSQNELFYPKYDSVYVQIAQNFLYWFDFFSLKSKCCTICRGKSPKDNRDQTVIYFQRFHSDVSHKNRRKCLWNDAILYDRGVPRVPPCWDLMRVVSIEKNRALPERELWPMEVLWVGGGVPPKERTWNQWKYYGMEILWGGERGTHSDMSINNCHSALLLWKQSCTPKSWRYASQLAAYLRYI